MRLQVLHMSVGTGWRGGMYFASVMISPMFHLTTVMKSPQCLKECVHVTSLVPRTALSQSGANGRIVPRYVEMVSDSCSFKLSPSSDSK